MEGGWTEGRGSRARVEDYLPIGDLGGLVPAAGRLGVRLVALAVQGLNERHDSKREHETSTNYGNAAHTLKLPRFSPKINRSRDLPSLLPIVRIPSC